MDMIDAELMDMEDGSSKIEPPKEQREVRNMLRVF